MKWVYLASAPDQLTAEMWRGLLLDAEVPAIISAGHTTTFLVLSPFIFHLRTGLQDQVLHRLMAGVRCEESIDHNQTVIAKRMAPHLDIGCQSAIAK